jgi:hypothetical protein
MSGFHLPGPWSAPQQERMCERCGRPTAHYGRRITASADEESDRASGEVAWFCNDCGHRADGAPPASGGQAPPGDELSELFDRH